MKKNTNQAKRTKFNKAALPWIFLVLVIGIALVVGFIFEECKLFDNKNFAEFIWEGFENRAQTGSDGRFAAYHASIYLFIISYSFSMIGILVKTDNINWCAIVIASSITFLVFMNVYLTVLYRNGAGSDRYVAYMNAYIPIVTIISAVAGIKMTYLFGKKKKRYRVLKEADGSAVIEELEEEDK